MIDMVFLLLVFFMTVSTIAKDARPELDLAVSTTAVVPEAAPPRDIITVRHEGDEFQYFWSNKSVDLDTLAELLTGRKDSSVGELLLRGGPDLPWNIWQKLLQLCREAGVSDSVFATCED